MEAETAEAEAGFAEGLAAETWVGATESWEEVCACCWRTEEMVERVPGVKGGAEEEPPTMARKAAVFGLGGGKATGPPTRGVRPVDGVRPVLKEAEGSKLKRGGCTAAAEAARAETEAGGWAEDRDWGGCC